MKKISDWLYEKSRGWVVLCALLIFLLFGMFVLPGQSAAAQAYSAEWGTPDTSFFYRPGDLIGMAESYGADGRQAYVQARFTFDLVFPLVFTFFLATSISWLLKSGLSPASSWRQLNLVPLGGMLFDYLENISAAWVIGRFPQPAPLFTTLAPVFTLLKWLMVGASFLLLIPAVFLFFKNQKNH